MLSSSFLSSLSTKLEQERKGPSMVVPAYCLELWGGSERVDKLSVSNQCLHMYVVEGGSGLASGETVPRPQTPAWLNCQTINQSITRGCANPAPDSFQL